MLSNECLTAILTAIGAVGRGVRSEGGPSSGGGGRSALTVYPIWRIMSVMDKSILDGLDSRSRELFEELQAQARDRAEAYRAAYVPRGITAEMVGHAAPVLVLQLWRNTDVVETKLHAGRGVWSDVDMLRKNTWATKLAIDMLRGLADLEKRGELMEEKVRDGFTRLQVEFADLIPAAPKSLRAGYVRDTKRRFAERAQVLNS